MTARTIAAKRPRKRWRKILAALLVLLALVVAHQMILTAVLAAAVLAAGLFFLRARWARYRAGGWIAARKRRRHQGTATGREIRAKLSPAAARKHAAVTCPGLRPAEAHLVIGKTASWPHRTIADTWASSRLVYAPPQSLKTALTSCWGADAPGAALLFSSRCDLYDHTYLARAARGPVLVLNADGEGGIPTDFAWSPVDGCEARATAMRRAGDLMDAAPHDPSGRDAHWDANSKRMLQFLLKAAALIPGGDLLTVQGWAADPLQAGKAAEALCRHDPGWGAALVSMVSQALNDERYWSAISSGVTTALAWLDDDAMGAVACPRPGDGVDLRGFIEGGCGTIYVIGADRAHGSLAPYFAAFGAEAFHVARSVAEAQPRRRLARPFAIVADEAATIVPLPWHKITAVAAGYNIGITACVQADSQITARWGEHDARTIRTNFTVKIIGPGFTDPGELEDLSRVCGEVDTWHGSSRSDLRKERLFPPERIRLLPDWHALVLHRNARPVKVTVTPAWDRPGYRRAEPGNFPVRPPVSQPAIEAPHREPIAPPYAPPVLVPAVPEEESWQASPAR